MHVINTTYKSRRGRCRTGLTILGGLGSLTLIAGCSDSVSPAARAAESANAQLQAQVYVQKNNIEFDNYNRRQQISDDPSTILWCTAYPSTPNARPQTYPIQGKLTSAGRSPYSSTQVSSSSGYSVDVPGPDKMYGSGVEYRYGFTPAGVYVDFTGIETICSTEPTVYQATQTTIVLKLDPKLQAANASAQAALKGGDRTGAVTTLENAVAAANAGGSK